MGTPDAYFEWLERLEATGKYNLSDIGIDADLKTIKEDPRFQKLYPTPEEFADPFVERTAILQEWEGGS